MTRFTDTTSTTLSAEANRQGTAFQPLKVGVIGLGTIGLVVAESLASGIEGLRLEAVSGHDMAKTRRVASLLGEPFVGQPSELAEICDVVVDCAPGSIFDSIAEPAILRGRHLITVNGAAILDRPALPDSARRHGARLTLATGALLGLDAVRAAARGHIRSVTLITRKPPAALAGAPHLDHIGVDLRGLRDPVRVFAGSAREGARGFPANVNVVAGLALAGIGADDTQLEVWADPTLSRNTHEIFVESDSACFTMRIENIPSPGKPATGLITALSVVDALSALTDPIRIGS